MSTSLPPQHPAVVLRSSYRHLQAMLATAIAIVVLAIAVAALAISTSSNRSGRSTTLPIPVQNQTYPGQTFPGLHGRG